MVLHSCEKECDAFESSSDFVLLLWPWTTESLLFSHFKKGQTERGKETSDDECRRVREREMNTKSNEKEASNDVRELMTWQSSSIKCVWLLCIWHCSRQVFRTIIFTDSIWVVMKYVKHVPIDWQTEFYCHHFYLVHPNAFLFEHTHATVSSFLRIAIRNASLLKLTEYLIHTHTHTPKPCNIYYTNTLSDCLNIILSASICSFALYISLVLCRHLSKCSTTIIQCRVAG